MMQKAIDSTMRVGNAITRCHRPASPRGSCHETSFEFSHTLLGCIFGLFKERCLPSAALGNH